MKLIKFDLPINGTKVKNLEELRDNLTDEILALARSGQLERWFRTRQLPEQAQAVATAVRSEGTNKGLFLALCRVLALEVHVDDVRAIFDAPPSPGRFISGARYFELYEKLMAVKDCKLSTINFKTELIKNNKFIPYQCIFRGDFLEVSKVFIKNKTSIVAGEKIAEVRIQDYLLEIISPSNSFVTEILIEVGDKIRIDAAIVEVLETAV